MGSRVFKITIVVSCMLLVLYAGQAFSQKLGTLPEKSVVSLELRDKPLKFVAEEIFKQTGYKVVFDKKWNDLPLSGQYTGVTLEEFFLRALRKQNVSLSYDDKSNIVNLRFFGDRGVGKINANTLASENVPNIKVNKDIKAPHGKLAAYLNDPKSVDPSSGMKLVDMRELHANQQAELARLRNDPETIDPMSGMKLGDIQELHNTQQVALASFRNDPEAIDPMSGMKLGDIQELHNTQQVELERLRNDPEAIDPGSGLTNAEIKKRHNQQTKK